jgi:hypothetical protein
MRDWWYVRSDNSTAIAAFSPPNCFGGGITGSAACTSITTPDCPVQFFPQAPQISDPYCTSFQPPTISSATQQDCNEDTVASSAVTSMSNCGPCNSLGVAYSWNVDLKKGTDTRYTTGTWSTASSTKFQLNGDNYWELFPGRYPGGISVGSGNTHVYLNPGVYTIGGIGFEMTSQAYMCVYGAPACDRTSDNYIPETTSSSCQNFGFGADPTSGSYAANAAQWYYYCPPMMIGQVVGDNFTYGGDATSELFYRPCSPSALCLSGPGSGLVE